jgi:hypothetical protein
MQILIDRLAQLVGGGALGAAAPRLRCETCSTPPASVELADGYSGMQEQSGELPASAVGYCYQRVDPYLRLGGSEGLDERPVLRRHIKLDCHMQCAHIGLRAFVAGPVSPCAWHEMRIRHQNGTRHHDEAQIRHCRMLVGNRYCYRLWWADACSEASRRIQRAAPSTTDNSPAVCVHASDGPGDGARWHDIGQ